MRRILRRLGVHWPEYDTIGRHRIRLPKDSRALEYKRRFRLYDTALGGIARIARGKYPDIHAIDIGANVGDTAALICKFIDIPVLCIEGDSRLLPLLRENTRGIGGKIEIEPGFIGTDGQSVNPRLIGDRGRNACLVDALDDGGPMKLRTLESVLADHPSFAAAKLLKTDTEGFDFDILRQSIGFIRRAKPVVFFEYDPHFKPSDPDAGLKTIEALIDAGYSTFVYFDNFGNLLLDVDSEQRGTFASLDRYLDSNRRHGPAVYYFDICAFHREDSDLAPLLKPGPDPEDRS
jgi:FkbM family methyltransferase